MGKQWGFPHNFNAGEGGMFRDVAPWQIPDGGVYDLQDLICDRPGMIRKRGGTTALGGGNQTAQAQSITAYKASTEDASAGVFGAAGGGLGTIAFYSTTGVPTTIVSSLTEPLSKPIQYLNHVVVCANSLATPSANFLAFVGGAQNATGHTGTVTLVANSPTVTDSTNSLVAGDVGKYLNAPIAGQGLYRGRIVAVTAVNSARVDPAPTIAGTTAAGGASIVPVLSSITIDATSYMSGLYAVAWQNRVLVANCYAAPNTGPRASRYPKRIWFSLIPTEKSTLSVTGAIKDGDSILHDGSFPANNFFDVSGLSGQITGLGRVGEGQLVVFSQSSMYRVTGNLTTQIANQGSITWDAHPISQQIGCVEHRSIQETPRGLVFAGQDGVYLYDGSQVHAIMADRWANQFRADLRLGYRVYGSALIRGNHYYLSYGSSDGSTYYNLLCNLDGYQWSRVTNTATRIWDASVDPSDPSITWATRWFDTALGVVTHTGGQLVRLESLFAPSSTTRSDSDATGVLFNMKTRAFKEGPRYHGHVIPSDNPKVWREGTISFDQRGGGGATLAASASLDPNLATFTTVATLGSTTPATVSTCTNASPIVVTTSAAHNLQDGDFVTVSNVAGATGANGEWRITFITGTTFSLNGSVAGGVYTSGGTVQRNPKKDFTLSGIGMGAAVCYQLSSAATLDSFELYTIKNAWHERAVSDE